MGYRFNPFTNSLDTISLVNQGDVNDVFIANDGKVGIGLTNPSSNLTVGGNPPSAGAIGAVCSASGIALALTDGTTSSFYVRPEAGGATLGTDSGGALRFSTNGNSSTTERGRIFSDGTFNYNGLRDSSIGLPMAGSGNVRIAATSSGGYCLSTFDDAAYTAVQFVRDVSGSIAQVGSITCSDTATAYNTSSDYRLKENVVSIEDGITRVKQLNPSRFNFTINPDITVDGFLAHEVQGVVPEAVHGEKDAVDEDNNPVYQGIDQSKLVPLLTAALQEAIAKIEVLEAKVTALEGG